MEPTVCFSMTVLRLSLIKTYSTLCISIESGQLKTPHKRLNSEILIISLIILHRLIKKLFCCNISNRISRATQNLKQWIFHSLRRQHQASLWCVISYLWSKGGNVHKKLSYWKGQMEWYNWFSQINRSWSLLPSQTWLLSSTLKESSNLFAWKMRAKMVLSIRDSCTRELNLSK